MKKFIQLLLTATLVFGFTAPIVQAKVPADKLEEKKKREKERGGKALGPRVGKKVQSAFELYSEDKVNEALEMLLEVETSDKFDRAYLDRFIGNMYAGQEGKAEIALDYLAKALKADQLPFNDHAGVIKLIADLSLQEKKYENAIKHYDMYIDFSLDQDPQVYLRKANAYYELRQYENVIKPAKQAIKLFETPNQNPYILIMASYYERKMYPESVKAVEELVKNFPEEPKWWAQLGMFYMLVEDYERGLSTMELAHKQGFLDKESQMKQLAQLYATNGIPYKAAVIQEQYINSGLIKKNEQALSIMANTFQNAKEYDKVVKYYGEAAKLSNSGELFKKQATVLLIKEKFKDAAVAYQKAIDAGVDRPGWVYMGLAEANFYLGKFEDAYAAILEAKKDKNTEKSAKGWEGYIKETASRKGVTL
jgi:tetratricopeptide (TPR) repeat protein